MKNTSRSFSNMLKEDAGFSELMPYERFVKHGAKTLTDAELLAIIIRTGTPTMTPVDIGRELLEISSKYEKGLPGLFHLNLEDYLQIPGIGKVKAIKLMCIAELSRRITKQQAAGKFRFHSPSSVADYYMEDYCHREKEHVLLLCLNNQLQLLSEEEIAVGTVNNVLLSARDVFISALKNRAVNIVLLHNHPGGDPTPSNADMTITRDIQEAGFLLDIKLIDHIIIGEHNYYSFLEKKLIF